MTVAKILHQRQQNQYLLDQKAVTPEDVVRTLSAVQAQDYAGAKWAIAQRTSSTTSANFDAMFGNGRLLRTHVLRPTWHFVLPEDIRWMLELTSPRIKMASQYYWRKLGLTDEILHRAIDVIGQALTGRQLTRQEVAVALQQKDIDASDGRLGQILMFAELEAVICSGPLRGKQHTYALLEERAPSTKRLAHDDALALLAQRFFTSHGPATLPDFTWWSGLSSRDAKQGLNSTQDQLHHIELDGKIYWSASETTVRATPVAHLLPNYDEYVVAYTDRAMLFDDAAYTKHLDSRQNPLFNHVVTINGAIVGTWKAIPTKAAVKLNVTLFKKLTSPEKQLLMRATKLYSAYNDLPVSFTMPLAA